MRRLKISFLLLAFMALMAHSIIPHHHHNTDSLYSHSFCCENHHESNRDSHTSDAGKQESSDCCKLKELLVTPPNIQKYSGLVKENTRRWADYNIVAIAVNHISVTESGATCKYLLPPDSGIPVILLTGPDSCRAPPVA